MALTKTITWNGLQVDNAYARIQKKEVRDYKEEDTKKYLVDVYIGVFTDDTKEYGLYGKAYKLEGFDNDTISHTEIYERLNKMEDFKDWTKC